MGLHLLSSLESFGRPTKEYLCFPLHNAISACCAPFADGLMCFLFQCMISWARTSKPSRHFLAPLSAILGWPWARTSKPSRYFLAPLSAILGWPWARTSKPSQHFLAPLSAILGWPNLYTGCSGCTILRIGQPGLGSKVILKK